MRLNLLNVLAVAAGLAVFYVLGTLVLDLFNGIRDALVGAL